MRVVLLAGILGLGGCCGMGAVDRARLEVRISDLGEVAAAGKSRTRAAEILSETAALVSDVDAAIR